MVQEITTSKFAASDGKEFGSREAAEMHETTLRHWEHVARIAEELGPWPRGQRAIFEKMVLRYLWACER